MGGKGLLPEPQDKVLFEDNAKGAENTFAITALLRERLKISPFSFSVSFFFLVLSSRVPEAFRDLLGPLAGRERW